MPRGPVNDQQSRAENGCELDNTQKNSRQRSSLEVSASDNRIVINLCVQTAQDGVSRHSLLPALELNNNRLQDNDDSLNATGKKTPTSDFRFDEHTVTRRSTGAREDLSQGLPATASSVQAWPLCNIQEQAKRMYQGIRKWVVRLFLYLAGPVPMRQRWNSTSDSIMGQLAVMVGLGNLWRFPYYCYKHKSVYFLIAYTVALLLIGFPMYVVDISVGQYLSLGPTNAYASMAPLFSGLGWAMVVSSALISIYYAVILGWTITYIQHSFKADFPFTNNSQSLNCIYEQARDFFRNEVIHLKGKDSEIQLQSVWSLGLVWLLIAMFLIRGIRSSKKVVYFTNTFPYGVILLLLIYSYQNDCGPEWDKIIDLFLSSTQEVTKEQMLGILVDAASHVLFTLGHLFGGAVTLASYNDLRQNTLWTAFVIVLWDTATSILCGWLVFVSMSKLPSNVFVDNEDECNGNHTVGGMGVEVVFIAYPAVLAAVNMNVWFVLFFLMILTLGIDSLMGLVETVTTALFDNFTHLRSRYFPSVCAVVLVLFLLGLPTCTKAGFEIVECMHSYMCNLSLPLLGITYIALVCYVFGFDNLMKILRQELRVTVPKFIEWYLRLALKYICPVAFFGLIISAAMKSTEFQGLHNNPLPTEYTPIGWILSIFPFLLVPAFAIYKFIRFRDGDWRLLLRPTPDFLPAYLREHSSRPEFILADY